MEKKLARHVGTAAVAGWLINDLFANRWSFASQRRILLPDDATVTVLEEDNGRGPDRDDELTGTGLSSAAVAVADQRDASGKKSENDTCCRGMNAPPARRRRRLVFDASPLLLCFMSAIH